jgi:hypothetical protein
MLDALCQSVGGAGAAGGGGSEPARVRVTAKQNDDLRKDRAVTELVALCSHHVLTFLLGVATATCITS